MRALEKQPTFTIPQPSSLVPYVYVKRARKRRGLCHLSALRVASDDKAADKGILVVMNDGMQPEYVTKTHTDTLATFHHARSLGIIMRAWYHSGSSTSPHCSSFDLEQVQEQYQSQSLCRDGYWNEHHQSPGSWRLTVSSSKPWVLETSTTSCRRNHKAYGQGVPVMISRFVSTACLRLWRGSNSRSWRYVC